MSATLPNVDGLARWLGNARLYETTFRPVPLSVFVKNGAALYELPTPEEIPARALPGRRGGETRAKPPAADHVAFFSCARPSRAGRLAGGVIVFARLGSSARRTRWRSRGRWTSPNRARVGARRLVRRASSDRVGSGVRRGARFETEKKPSPGHVRVAGRRLAPRRGCSAEEKSIVERGFREGLLRVVCCTTTMATA